MDLELRVLELEILVNHSHILMEVMRMNETLLEEREKQLEKQSRGNLAEWHNGHMEEDLVEAIES